MGGSPIRLGPESGGLEQPNNHTLAPFDQLDLFRVPMLNITSQGHALSLAPTPTIHFFEV